MPGLLIGWVQQTLLDSRQVQQVRVPPAYNDPRSTSSQPISKRSGIARQAVQARQDVGEGKRKRGGIAADHRSGPQSFSPVIAIAHVSERREPLVGMSLQDRRSRACDFSPLASQVSGCRDQVKAAMRSRKVCGLGKCPLSGRLLCSIDIHHGPMVALPVPHSPRRGGERRSCHQVFLRIACGAPPRELDQGRQESGKALQDEAGSLSQKAP